jgi:hypothetical protein
VQARRAPVGRADDTGLYQAVTSRAWRRRSCRVTLDFQTLDSLTVPADSSAAAEIAAALPHSAVL